MMSVYMVQLRKLFSRGDVRWIVGIFALLPFAIAFLIAQESGVVQIGDSVFTAMGYSSVVVGLLNSLLLVSVTVALVTTAVIAKEIDTGLDGVYVTKVHSRGQLILSKMAALDLLSVAVFAAMLISAIVGWLVFLKDSPYGTDAIWSAQGDGDETFMLLYTVLGSFFETLVLIRLYTLMSLLFKYGKAIVFNFATVVVFKLLGNIEAVQRWIPSYIGEGTYLLTYAGDKLLLNGVLGLGVLFGYALVLTGINYLVYKHMDLAR